MWGESRRSRTTKLQCERNHDKQYRKKTEHKHRCNICFIASPSTQYKAVCAEMRVGNMSLLVVIIILAPCLGGEGVTALSPEEKASAHNQTEF